MERGNEPAAPVTTRLAGSGGPDRRLRVAIALVATGVALAILKPWDLVPGRSAEADVEAPLESAHALRDAAASPRPTPWTGIGERLACFSGRTWMVVVDERDDGRVTRSWTALAPAPAVGPADLAIVGTHVYAEAVLRLGFCAPAAATAEAEARPFDVDLWRLEHGSNDGDAREVPRRLVAGGTEGVGGALYAPGGRIDGRDPTAEPAWPAGTYVFRVRLAAVGRAGPDEAWFAVELRGPWRGPDPASPVPTASPASDPASPIPTTSPAPG